MIRHNDFFFYPIGKFHCEVCCRLASTQRGIMELYNTGSDPLTQSFLFFLCNMFPRYPPHDFSSKKPSSARIFTSLPQNSIHTTPY